MLDGALILWFMLTFLSFIYAAYDLIRTTPAEPVIKIGWLLVILYTGPFGLFMYLLSCKEPLPGEHETFTSNLWKQSLGSEIHCVAGDATGIIIAAIVLSFLTMSDSLEIIIEYIAGFASGWLIFQSIFMKKMFNNSYRTALKKTFMPEWLSMNMIMAGMMPVTFVWRLYSPLSMSATTLPFWGSMALATIVGSFLAYPINVWLVKTGLKHGMSTVKKETAPAEHKNHGNRMNMPTVSVAKLTSLTILTLIFLAVGISVPFLLM